MLLPAPPMAFAARFPIHDAARRGACDDLARLLEVSSEDAAERDWGGYTALHWAALNDEADALALLLNSGVAVDARDGGGNTSLALAAWSGSESSVQTLLANGADPSAEDAQGVTALAKAQNSGHQGIVQILSRGGTPTGSVGSCAGDTDGQLKTDSCAQMRSSALSAAGSPQPAHTKRCGGGTVNTASAATRSGRSAWNRCCRPSIGSRADAAVDSC